MLDVVFASGAIESCYLRIRRLTTALARVVVVEATATPGVVTWTRAMTDPALARLIASVEDAYRDYNTMLFWGRSLLHRIEGDWGGEVVAGVRVGAHRVGLVDFLSKSEALKVRTARDRLVEGAFAEVRNLADYSLHAFAVPRALGLLTYADDGTFRLPHPDRLGRRPEVGEAFTFHEKRHVAAEAAAIWRATEEFVSGIFDTLEASQLRREEKLPRDRADSLRAQLDRFRESGFAPLAQSRRRKRLSDTSPASKSQPRTQGGAKAERRGTHSSR